MVLIKMEDLNHNTKTFQWDMNNCLRCIIMIINFIVALLLLTLLLKDNKGEYNSKNTTMHENIESESASKIL